MKDVSSPAHNTLRHQIHSDLPQQRQVAHQAWTAVLAPASKNWQFNAMIAASCKGLQGSQHQATQIFLISAGTHEHRGYFILPLQIAFSPLLSTLAGCLP